MTVDFTENIASMSGKPRANASGYFYKDKKTGKTHFREREETYQRHQSPRQQWNSAAFAYAQKRINALEADSDALSAATLQWKDTHHMLPGSEKVYKTVHSYMFNFYQREWRVEHPFEAWFQTFMDSQTSSRETSSLSKYQLKKELDKLELRMEQLRAELRAHS